jgi:hypothetical protein
VVLIPEIVQGINGANSRFLVKMQEYGVLQENYGILNAKAVMQAAESANDSMVSEMLKYNRWEVVEYVNLNFASTEGGAYELSPKLPKDYNGDIVLTVRYSDLPTTEEVAMVQSIPQTGPSTTSSSVMARGTYYIRPDRVVCMKVGGPVAMPNTRGYRLWYRRKPARISFGTVGGIGSTTTIVLNENPAFGQTDFLLDSYRYQQVAIYSGTGRRQMGLITSVSNSLVATCEAVSGSVDTPENPFPVPPTTVNPASMYTIMPVWDLQYYDTMIFRMMQSFGLTPGANALSEREAATAEKNWLDWLTTKDRVTTMRAARVWRGAIGNIPTGASGYFGSVGA